MCDKVVKACFSVSYSVPDQYKYQEIYDRVVSEDPFMLKYCPEKSKPQKMCVEAVDDCLGPLKFIPGWFVTSKMLQKFHDSSFTNDKIPFFDKDFGNATFFANEMGISSLDLSIKLTLMMIKILIKMILKLIFMSDFWLVIINLKNLQKE